MLFFVPTDIQKSNNVKLVQSSVPLGSQVYNSQEYNAFALPSLLNVVIVVVDNVFAMPICFNRLPRVAVRCFEARSPKSLPVFLYSELWKFFVLLAELWLLNSLARR